MAKNILFVCTGNTCRSSMAEHLFTHLIDSAGRSDDFVVRSAGVAAMPKDPAAQQAIQVLDGKGIISIQSHEATPLNDQLVEEADLILTMTRSHKERVLRLYPECEEKVFTLKEYTQESGDSEDDLDIEDPFGQSVDVYRECAEDLENRLLRLLKHI